MGKIFDALEKSGKDHKKTSDIHGSIKGESDLIGTTVAEVNNDFHESDYTGDVPAKLGFNKDRIDKNLVCYFRPHTYEAEQFRILKTGLLFPDNNSPARTIMITSSDSGEGKSFVAANLAISMAQSMDDHVLLMDCDIRRPSIHKRFGFNGVPGLSEYLKTGVSIPSLLCKTIVNKLTILPGGKPPRNPSELVTSARMLNLIDELRLRYRDRYVIVDAPPPHLTAEANALAKKVDGILLVVKYGKTSRKNVKGLVDMFGREKILGVIFNGFDMKLAGRYGGYGKYGTSVYGQYYGDEKAN